MEDDDLVRVRVLDKYPEVLLPSCTDAVGIRHLSEPFYAKIWVYCAIRCAIFTTPLPMVSDLDVNEDMTKIVGFLWFHYPPHSCWWWLYLFEQLYLVDGNIFSPILSYVFAILDGVTSVFERNFEYDGESFDCHVLPSGI